jgi:hypothetical protein
MTLHVTVCERRDRLAQHTNPDVTAIVAARMGKGGLPGQLTAISIVIIALALWSVSEHG